MKKSGIFVFMAITLACLLLTAGIYLFQNIPHDPAQMETLPTTATQAPPSALININTANQVELMALPGIGETLAFRIIAYREIYGDFQSVEELTKVEGIGEKTFQDILPYITVGG